MDVWLLLAAAVAAAAWWLYQRHRRAERREALFALAQRHGLDYARRDVIGVSRLPFVFLRRGDDRGIENVVHGELDGEEVRVFDFWYAEESTDSDGHTTRTTHRFTCAATRIPGVMLPGIRLAPETISSRLKDAVGFGDIQFESDEFNREWNVESRDERAASTVVAPRMMSWLLMTDGRFRFELLDDKVLLIADEEDPGQFLVLHKALRQFRDRVPEVTAELYPAEREGP